MGVTEEKLHCSKVQNESLHEKNKSLEKQLYETKKQLNAVRSNKDAKLETLQRQNKDSTLKHEELVSQNTNLKNNNVELVRQIAEIQEDKQNLQLQLEIGRHKLHEATTELDTIEKFFRMTV